VAAVLVSVELVVVAGAEEGDGLAKLLGLKKSASVFFAGEGDEVTVGETAAAVFALRPRFFSVAEGDAAASTAGDADAAGLATGLAAAPVFAFLRARFALGEAAGDSAVEGDTTSWASEAVAEAFLDTRCFFAGEGDSVGD
jgi:hypothetical protein